MSANPTTRTDGGADEDPHPRKRPRMKPAVLVHRARQQLEEVIGLRGDSVSALNENEEGWELNVEVVEVARIPETSSILATYSVQLDSEGDLVAYERVRRYSRGQLNG